MRRLSVLSSLLVPFAALALLGACGCGTNQATGQKRIIILTNGESPFWDAGRQGMEAAAKDLDLDKAGLRIDFQVNDRGEEGQLDRLRQFSSQSDIAAIAISV